MIHFSSWLTGRFSPLSRLVFASVLLVLPASMQGQSCAGPNCFEQQQIACPGGGTTTISGTIFTPNGTDPLPNVMVYVPDGPVAAFTPGVACELPGTLPSGAPLIGTSTNYKGQFVLANAPVGTNIPIVIQAGRWRRQLVVPVVSACQNNVFDAHMPKNKSEGDIPKIALTTGSADALECVLSKMGIDNSEVTNSLGTGRIHLYTGTISTGSSAGGGTKTQEQLMTDAAMLNQYDVVMFACQGQEWLKTNDNTPEAILQRNNLIAFANAGGRVFGTHFEYGWFLNNGPFNDTAQWRGASTSLSDQPGYINTTFPGGKTLAQWLQYIGASSTYAQMPLSQVRRDTTGVIAPTQEWMHINDGTPMQFTFNTPIGNVAGQQCGRVLYNDYHVESVSAGAGKIYPAECSSTSPMTPQEKLLEFGLFDLSGSGAAPSIAPESADFGRSAVGVQTVSQTFKWTNSTIFPIFVALSIDPDFAITSTTCGTVAAGGSCDIAVAFKPTALGKRTGTLTVTYAGNTTTAALSGTGVPDLEQTPATMDFGKVDIGGMSAAQTFTVTNNLPQPVPLAGVTVVGDYVQTSTCVNAIAASSTCTISVSFHPGTTGPRNGAVTLTPVDPKHGIISGTMTGIGVDFGLAIGPNSGNVIAGYNTSTGATLTPIAGFSAPVSVSCTTNATASTCTPSQTTVGLSSNTKIDINITTTAKYTVVGYGGVGGGLWITLAGLGGGLLVLTQRRRMGTFVRAALVLVFAAVVSGGLSGCTGKLPDLNPAYTAPGDYTYTVTATDGFLTRSATYSLHVTVAK